MVQNLSSVRKRIINMALAIETMFLEGAKVTILVRNPSLDDADLLITNDDEKDVIKAIEHLKDKKSEI